MQKNSLSLASLLTCFLFEVFAGSLASAQTKEATFYSFEYKGTDTRFDRKINPQKEYFNPILSGFYPDPSICRKGNDYYLVNSSFAYFPGIPIFHSTDLVNWQQIGSVLNRPSQLNVEGVGLSRGIFAPAIQYNKYNDTFYLITTDVSGIGNFIVKTKDPMSGNWSDPIPLPQVTGIDPSLFFDDNGKAYIVHNDAPEGTPQWDGHRAIWIHEFDVATDKTQGKPQVLLNGGVDPSSHPVWIEGPHLYKVKGKYYLICAEGGTSVNHTEVVLSSDRVTGAFVPYKANPILSQKGLPENRPDIVTSVGHADLVETPQGEWYAVFLGCRPYQGNYYNTGRETFLLPVTWKDGFPIILDKGLSVPVIQKKKHLSPSENNFWTGNFTQKADFNNPTLGKEWLWVRNQRGNWWQLRSGTLVLSAIPRNLFDIDNPAYIGRRQQHTAFEAQTKVSFIPTSENELAGIVCYQNETHHFVLGKTHIGNKDVIVLNRAENEDKRIAQLDIPEQYRNQPVCLRVIGNGAAYSFAASFDEGQSWQTVAKDIDAKNLSTQVAGGFVGSTIGVYATSAHKIPALKEAYTNYFHIGTAVSMNHLRGQEATLVSKHFNSITAENDMKPINLLRKDGTYNYDRADRIVQFARNNGMKVRGHTLIWHKQTPDWFFLNENGLPLDSTALYSRLDTYITDVMQHFGDDIYAWDVVNEALSDNAGELFRTDSPWYKACQEAYIAHAFRTAHRVNPKMKLFYNDYNLTQPAKRQKAYTMLKALLEAGVPITGVGMQGHWSMQDITPQAIQESIDLFSSLGLEIQITELDLTTYSTYHGEGAKNQVKETRAWTPQLETEQAEVFKAIFEVFRANKNKITSVTLWGLADNYTWLDNFPVPNRKDYPLLFNQELEPKKAFWEMLDF